MPFSTYDRGNTVCAKYRGGGYWYNKCDENVEFEEKTSNLNGVYLDENPHDPVFNGIVWARMGSRRFSLQFSEMKIRPDNF